MKVEVQDDIGGQILCWEKATKKFCLIYTDKDPDEFLAIHKEQYEIICLLNPYFCPGTDNDVIPGVLSLKNKERVEKSSQVSGNEYLH